MPVMLKHTSRGSRKRHTWPRAVVEQLETIPESPRTPTKFDPFFAIASQTPGPAEDVQPNNEQQCPPVKHERTPEELGRAQMLWYSHHLAESQQDRERLGRKIKKLEHAYRAQAQTNVGLVDDIKSWQNSYDLIEAELVEAAQEIEEAKAYVRSIETSNANLRYALSQAKEQAHIDKQRRWRFRILRLLTTAPTHIAGLFRSRKVQKTGENPLESNESREGSETPVMRPTRDEIDRSGAYSRLSQRSPDPELPSSSPRPSSLSEKG